MRATSSCYFTVQTISRCKPTALALRATRVHAQVAAYDFSELSSIDTQRKAQGTGIEAITAFVKASSRLRMMSLCLAGPSHKHDVAAQTMNHAVCLRRACSLLGVSRTGAPPDGQPKAGHRVDVTQMYASCPPPAPTERIFRKKAFCIRSEAATSSCGTSRGCRSSHGRFRHLPSVELDMTTGSSTRLLKPTCAQSSTPAMCWRAFTWNTRMRMCSICDRSRACCMQQLDT